MKKNGKVTPQEFEIIKKHAQLGYTVLLRTKGVSQDVKFAALQHHEEWMVVDIRYVSDLVKFMNLQKLLWSVMFMMQ